MRSRKVDQLSLAISLEREQADLIARMQSEFWQGLFCDILKKHTYQNDFFFVENNLKSEDFVYIKTDNKMTFMFKTNDYKMSDPNSLNNKVERLVRPYLWPWT